MVVDGVNMIKKHVKPNPQAGVQGGIIEREAALDMSNVALFNAKTGKAGQGWYQGSRRRQNVFDFLNRMAS